MNLAYQITGWTHHENWEGSNVTWYDVENPRTVEIIFLFDQIYIYYEIIIIWFPMINRLGSRNVGPSMTPRVQVNLCSSSQSRTGYGNKVQSHLSTYYGTDYRKKALDMMVDFANLVWFLSHLIGKKWKITWKAFVWPYYPNLKKNLVINYGLEHGSWVEHLVK